MPKLNIFYIISLVVVAALLGLTMFYSMATGEDYSTVYRENLLQTGDGYIVEFDIMNHEGETKQYTINMLVDGKLYYTDDILVLDGRVFTFGRHINPDRIANGKVSFAIYKEGEDTPFEEITYYLE